MVTMPFGNNLAFLCTATPDAPSDEDSRWSPACMLEPGHDGEHEAANPESGLDATIRWKGDV